MTLATRCPTCSTAFRVVQDQLRVSAGWVRCGRCGEVFNASESLHDIDAPPAPAAASGPPGASLVQRIDPTWQVPGRPNAPAPVSGMTAHRPPPPAAPEPAPPAWMAPSEPPSEPPAEAPAPQAPQAPAGVPDDEPAAPPPWPAHADDGADIAGRVSEAAPLADEPGDPIDRDLIDTEQIDSAMDEPDSPDLPPSLVPDRPDSRLEDEDEAVETPAPDALPAFVRQADRAARWRRPWVRALLSLAALGLGAALLAQLALVQRDGLAARMPALKPTLAALCEVADCRIEAPRRIDQLAVESSGLARVEGAPLYRLSLVLRNRADIALMLPAVELTITDAAGQVVARRVLTPAEAGAAHDTIDGGQELPLTAMLSVAERRLAGYTIELFYP